MALFPTFLPGWDATASTDCITRAQLLQSIVEAQFTANSGAIVWSEAAPDVVTYPILARFIWGKTVGGFANGEFYWYDGAAWSPWKIPDGSLTGAAFADGSIDIIKLSTVGSVIGDIIRVGAAGFEFISILNHIANGSFPVVKLESGVALPDYMIITDNTGAFVVRSLSNLLASAFITQSVPISTIYDDSNVGLAKQVLTLKADPAQGFELKYVEDNLRQNQTPISSLLFPAGSENKAMVVNGIRTDVQFVPMPVALVRNQTTGVALPTGIGDANAAEWLHALGARPKYVNVTVVSIDAGGDAGYDQGRELDFTAIQYSAGLNEQATFGVERTATMIRIIAPVAPAGAYIHHATTGAVTTIDIAKWAFNIEVSL